MLATRIRRTVAVASIVALPLLAIGSFAGQASASTGLKIKCTHLTGTITGNSQYMGCTAAATGGSSVAAPGGSCQTNCSTTTMWTNGKSTSWNYNATIGGTLCGSNVEVTIKGTVTADDTGFAPVGGGGEGHHLCQHHDRKGQPRPGYLLQVEVTI